MGLKNGDKCILNIRYSIEYINNPIKFAYIKYNY